MITRKRVHELHDKLSNMRDVDMLCVSCHSSVGQYHGYDCALANAADALIEMYEMLDGVHNATLPFRLGGSGE